MLFIISVEKNEMKQDKNRIFISPRGDGWAGALLRAL